MGFAFSYAIAFYAKGTFGITEKSIAAKLQNQVVKEGDIIFQTSRSGQSKAIQLATQSVYSHMGVIFKLEDDFYVFEAVQPVKFTLLESWIKRGKDGHFVLKRLKNSDELLTPQNIEKMKVIGKSFLNKNYDGTFEWSDEKMYCSELVWKIYNRGIDVNIGELQTLKEFDLTHQAVKEKIKQRYGDNIPWEEKVISPARMFNAEQLYTILEN